MIDPLQHLIGLLVVCLVAIGGVALLLRSGGRRAAPGALVGYPPDRFPQREITGAGPLAELAATQARLLAIRAHLPPQSSGAIWLGMFLAELREIMDTAYRVALVARVYGRAAPLEPLLAEVQRVEAELVSQLERRMLARDADAHDELLEGRLETLRLCARELAQGLG